MGFWSGSKLATEIPKHSIINPFRPNQIDCSAYTLTMGREYYITPSDSLRFKPHVKQKLKAPVPLKDWDGTDLHGPDGNALLAYGESFAIPSGQFGLLLTEEYIRLPADVMGFISLKSHPKFQGLINVSGFHVDPGFEGHLIFSVFNAGPSTIQFRRGQQLFLIWIADLAGDNFDEYKRSNSAPLLQIGEDIISRVPGEMISLQSLSERIDRMEPTTMIVRSGAFALITAVALILALLALTNVKLRISLDSSKADAVTEGQ
jgi:dCTP deaminase